jgi:hypothetical protein
MHLAIWKLAHTPMLGIALQAQTNQPPDFASSINPLSVIPSTVACASVSTSSPMASDPEPVPIKKARLSRTSFDVEENPYGFMS